MCISPFLCYIDPGSGMIVLQLIMAAAVGTLVFFRKMIYKAVGVITGRGKKQMDEIPVTPETKPAAPVENAPPQK